MSVVSTLQTQVLEGGSLQVSVTLYDENGDEVTPSTLSYSLLNESESIINDKEDISLSAASSVDVWLSGDDCPEGKNYFVLSGTYDGADGTTDLPIRAYASYTISRLPGN